MYHHQGNAQENSFKHRLDSRGSESGRLMTVRGKAQREHRRRHGEVEEWMDKCYLLPPEVSKKQSNEL